MTAAVGQRDGRATRRLLATLGLALVSTAGFVSCGNDGAASGSLSWGEHALTGEFKDTSDMKLPPPTFPWEATLDIGTDQWCLTRLTVDHGAVAMSDGKTCGSLASAEPSSVALGTSGRGSVFAIYAPGHRAAGIGMSGASGAAAGSATWSQEGPLILVLLDGVSQGTVQLVDSARQSTEVQVG
jgi:hypothetical protein